VGQQQVPVEDVLRKEQYRQISDALARAGQSRVRLPLDQYLDLCRQYAPPSPRSTARRGSHRAPSHRGGGQA